MENVPQLEGTLGRKPEQEEPTCGNTIDIGIKPLLTSGFGFRVSGFGLRVEWFWGFPWLFSSLIGIIIIPGSLAPPISMVRLCSQSAPRGTPKTRCWPPFMKWYFLAHCSRTAGFLELWGPIASGRKQLSWSYYLCSILGSASRSLGNIEHPSRPMLGPPKVPVTLGISRRASRR